jgi:branched-chain amino acid transport system permease protein
MLNSILSDDLPRSRLLTAVLLLILLGLAGGPFLFDGSVAFRTMSMICIFIIVVAAYDMLIGYTAVVSFAHMMFFGIGAYSMAIMLREFGASWPVVLAGIGVGQVLTIAAALLLGLLSLRVRAIFFALVTLAVASSFLVLLAQFYHFTGGEDGLRVRVPSEIGPAFRLTDTPWRGFNLFGFIRKVLSGAAIGEAWSQSFYNVRLTGRLLMYYILFSAALLLFLLMLRMMNSPYGRVLQAIRENEFRAEALGYRTVVYRTASVVFATCFTAFAGALFALSTRYVNPETTVSFSLMVFVLLMTVIGGMGTLYGAVIGATIFLIAENYLQDLLRMLSEAATNFPLLAALFHPSHWLLWFGLLFILSVYFFPQGVAGQLRIWAAKRRERRRQRGVAVSAADRAFDIEQR